MLFIEIGDLLQVRLLGFVVERAQVLIAFEQEVFQVVSQAGRIGWILFTASTHSNFRIETGLGRIAAQVDLQAVVQFIDLGFQRIVRIRRIDQLIRSATVS